MSRHNANARHLVPARHQRHFHGVGSRRRLDQKHQRQPDAQTVRFDAVLAARVAAGIFLGCVGKSAQFPLQVWLPDAMEGPTPVSALIHAATMVAAASISSAGLSALHAGSAARHRYTGGHHPLRRRTIALVQTDIKKVLAYSRSASSATLMLWRRQAAQRARASCSRAG